MSALKWQKQMAFAPRLRHDGGYAIAVLDERSVVFPSEADTRFFVEAYTELPNLASQLASLRSEIDEGALHKARARALELEAETAELRRKLVDLQERLVLEVQRRTAATRRATVLAKALRKVRDLL